MAKDQPANLSFGGWIMRQIMPVQPDPTTGVTYHRTGGDEEHSWK